MTSSFHFDYKDLGSISYGKALECQHEHHKLCTEEKIDGIFLGLEHLPVITIGKHASSHDILYSEAFLKAKRIELFRSDRGGKVTCHMPGQIILYPILSLSKLSLGVKEYVHLLEESLLDLLLEFGVKGELDKNNPGVWVSGKKIASIGVRIKDRVTLHGLALNVDNDLDLFNFIIPCGMKNCQTTRLIDHTPCEINKAQISNRLANKIGKRLDRKRLPLSPEPTKVER